MLSAGAIAGCGAIGLGALCGLAAPAANAHWGRTSGSTTTNTTSTGNVGNNNSGVAVTVSNTNGNVTQTNTRSGNVFGGQLGLLGTNTSTSAPIGNVAAANGVGNTVAVVATQITTGDVTLSLPGISSLPGL